MHLRFPFAARVPFTGRSRIAPLTRRLLALAVAGLTAIATGASGCGQGPAQPGGPDRSGGVAATFNGPESDSAVGPGGKADGTNASSAPGQTIPLQLDSHPAPVAGHPSAVVYIPSRFDPTPPVNVIVFLHGWYNCAENVVRNNNSACQSGGAPRMAYNLAAQLETSGRNAILLVPELQFDRANSDAGPLGQPGAMAAVIGETFTRLSDVVQLGGMENLGHVVVASHSGGYMAAAAIATGGGVPVTELYLLDSLYGEQDQYASWMQSEVDLITQVPPMARFASVYTLTGGTLANSQAMADQTRNWLAQAGATPDVVQDDRTTSTWTPDQFAHGALFKRSALAHDNVPRFYFGRLLATSVLPAVAGP
jgi:hypothetical protein